MLKCFHYFCDLILKTSVLINWDCCNKVPHTEWLKQQKFIVLFFWRLEVQNQDHRKAMLPLEVLGKPLFRASLLASGNSLACSNIIPIFLTVCLHVQISLFKKDSSHWIRHPTLIWPHFNLTNYIFNDYFQKGHSLRYWGLGVQHTNFFWGGHNSTPNKGHHFFPDVLTVFCSSEEFFFELVHHCLKQIQHLCHLSVWDA